jgi:putative glutamine amidotransferase
MKKSIYLAIAMVLLSFGGSLYSQTYFGTNDFDGENKHLVLTHPTVYNLKTFACLLEDDMVSLEQTKVVGVYYEEERYDYSKTKVFLDTCRNLPVDIILHKVTGALNPGQLFKKNELSDDYQKIFHDSQGIIFFGGPDMPPSTYGEKTNLLTAIYDPYRHYFELSFLYHLTGGNQNPNYKPLLEKQTDYLIYGFCLGMQSMSVAAGGTMVQDIPTEIYELQFAEEVIGLDQNKRHRNYYRTISIDGKLLSGSFHQVRPVKNSILDNYSQNNGFPLVYSNHHQCIDELGDNYKVIARSVDSEIIEAIRHNTFNNVIGVQFHPEAMRLYDENIQFRLVPDGELKTGKSILEKNNSFQFHKNYWKDFEKRFNAVKRN